MQFELLLDLLADGQFHSGQSLGDALGVSRTAVWKQIKKLELLGVRIDSVHGKGYRLHQSLELLKKEKICAEFSETVKERIEDIEVCISIDSTNEYLINYTIKKCFVCVAEQQTNGRGRRGKNWASPFGRNIYLSLCWFFQGGAAQLEGLSLAVAVAVARALEDCGVKHINVKWPNDLLYQGRKLAGILLEMSGDADGVCKVVIGVGVNVDMHQCDVAIDQPWIDAVTAAGRSISRNQLAGKIINQLVMMLEQFQDAGFLVFKSAWMEKDLYFDKHIRLTTPSMVIEGIGKGVDDRGALCLETVNGLKTFHGGEISLRSI